MMNHGLSLALAFVTLGAMSVSAHADRGRDADPVCKSAFGKTVCGYSCVAAFGDIKCADRPGGVCKAAFGEIVCYDPPRTRRGYGYTREQADCLSAYGKTVCGYGCKAAFGEIRCGDAPGATCLASYGQIACGFGCVAAYGEVKCASRPGGTCVAAYGEVTCSR